MKDVWKFSCRPPCCHVSAFGQARSIKCLPTMSLSHSTMVCTLPRVWCEAGLTAMLTVRFPVSNSIEKLEWPLAIALDTLPTFLPGFASRLNVSAVARSSRKPSPGLIARSSSVPPAAQSWISNHSETWRPLLISLFGCTGMGTNRGRGRTGRIRQRTAPERKQCR